MAKIHYSDFVEGLDAAATLDGTELIAGIQDGVPVKITTQDIADLGGGGGGGGASYLVYTALLSQSGTDDPVATVLENTLGGTVVWTRGSAGIYYGALSGVFTDGKTALMLAPTGSANSCARIDANTVAVATLVDFVTPSDDFLSGTTIEIRVYP